MKGQNVRIICFYEFPAKMRMENPILKQYPQRGHCMNRQYLYAGSFSF